MAILKVSQEQAERADWHKMKSLNWKLPDVRGGTSVVRAEFEGPHGKVRTRKGRERIYYVLAGQGQFESGEETISVKPGDVVVIPPDTWYNYRPVQGRLEVLVIMDFWNS